MTKEEMYLLIEQHYRTNFKRLVKVFTTQAESRQNAEDIVQDTYLRACEYWGSYKVDDNFNGWIMQILINCLRAKLNDERHHGMIDTQVMVREEQPRAINQMIVKQVEHVINNKPQKVNKILKLYFLEQYSQVDIEKLVPETLHAIEMITSRFRQEMKALFNTRLFEKNG